MPQFKVSSNKVSKEERPAVRDHFNNSTYATIGLGATPEAAWADAIEKWVGIWPSRPIEVMLVMLRQHGYRLSEVA